MSFQRISIHQAKKRFFAGEIVHFCPHKSYFEHGQCSWFRKDGEVSPGIEFQWDGVRVAGLLVWEHDESEMGAKTFQGRTEDADCFLRSYTAWANGEGYYYRIEDEDGETIDSCGGFLGDPEYMLDEMAHYLKGHKFKVTGDAKYLESQLRRSLEGAKP